MASVHLLSFLVVATVIVITPGVDMALVTRHGLRHGRQAALAAAFGINAGIAVWTFAAAFGLAALIAASAIAFSVVKIAGAVFLIYLGLKALLSARSGGADPPITSRHPSSGAAFKQGLASNLLNPKIAVLFTSLLPQFSSRGSSVAGLLVLGGLFNGLGLVWLTAYALVVARSRNVLSRPRIKSALDAVSGCVLVGLGLRVAFERR